MNIFFSISDIFTLSNEFKIESADHQSVIIDIKSDDSNQSNKSIKIGVGVTCAIVGVSAIAVIGLFFLRKRKLSSVEDIDEQTIE